MEIEDLEPGQAMAVDWTEREYFADRRCLTRSALAQLGSLPAAFYVGWELDQPLSRHDSEDMKLGRAAHLAILEPAEYQRRAPIPEIPKPDGARRNAPAGSRARLLYENWRALVDQREAKMAEIHDRLDLSLATSLKISAMVDSVWSHHWAATLLSAPGVSEQTVVWREPITGLLIKVRLDRYVELDDELVFGSDLEPGPGVVDLKTTRDHSPRAFGYAVRDHGYDFQAAIYSDATEALIGRRPSYYLIAVRKEPIARTAVYRLSDEKLAAGRERYQKLLLELLERRFTDDWTADYERGVNVL